MVAADVLIFMGSDSDYEVMKEAVKVLKEFSVSFDVKVSSAHRTPERTRKLVAKGVEEGAKVIIVGAGAAAHLGGVIASETTLPVIGVPIDSTPLNGVDALYSTVQMPGGIPVAAMAIGKAGAKNAGLFAVEILAINDDSLKRAMGEYRKKMAAAVEKKSDQLQI